MKKRCLAILLAVAMLMGMAAVPAFAAEGTVLYVSGSGADTNDGTAPQTALASVWTAIEKLPAEGGTVVVCGDLTVTTTKNPQVYTWTAKSGKVSVVGKYGETDYNPTITFAGKKNVIDCASEIEFNNLTLNHTASSATEFYVGPSLTFGDDMTFLHDGGPITLSANGWIDARLGNYSAACENSKIEIFSGTLSYIQGGNNKQPVTNATIILHPGVELTDLLQCGGTNKNVTNSNVILNGAAVSNLYFNGYNTAEMGSVTVSATDSVIGHIADHRTAGAGKITGNVTATFDNCTIGTMDMTVSTIEGTTSLTLKNMPELTLANDLSAWDALTLEKTILTVDAPYKGPSSVTADADSKIYVYEKDNATLPEVAGVTVAYKETSAEPAPEPVGTLTEVYLDDTAPDGGAGTKESPVNTMEKAFAALKEGDGTIYVVGEYTNSTAGMYIFPDHNGKVTITGTDENAKLHFDGNAKVEIQFRSPVVLNNITLVYKNPLNKNMNIYAGQELYVGENVTFICSAHEEMATGCIAIRGGYNSADYCSEYCDNLDTKITMMSGTISYLMGGNDNINIGNATINFGGTAKLIARMQGSGANSNDVGNCTINITGGEIRDLVIVGHGGEAAINGDAVVNITGGTIASLFADRSGGAIIGGDLTMNIGGTATIDKLNLNSSLLTAETLPRSQTLVFTGTGVKVGSGFGDAWDSITLADNATVNMAGAYTAAENTELNLADGAILYLNNESGVNTAEPAYNKTGVAKTGKVVLTQMHSISYVAAKEATELSAGYAEHYVCSVCGKYFTDAEGVNETAWEDLTIPAIGYSYHNYVEGSNYALTKLMTASGGQGNAISGNILVTADKTGYCNMYDVTTGEVIAAFPLGSYNGGTLPQDAAQAAGTAAKEWTNHSNQIMFGASKFDESDPLPLLYVTTGNSGAHDGTGAYIAKCAVERIRQDENGKWYAETVQIIEFNDVANIPDQDGNANKNMNVASNTTDVLTNMYDDETGAFLYVSGNGYDASKGYQKVGWGWPASFVDSNPTETTAGKFYLYSARYRTTEAYEPLNRATYGNNDPEWSYWDTNAYIITEFDLPALPASESAEDGYGKIVTLYPKDITNQFTTQYDIGFTQGGTLYQGKLYYSYGNKGAADNLYLRNGVQVFDMAQEKIVAFLPLYESEVKGMEPECLSIWNDELVLGLNGSGYEVFVFNYVALDPVIEEPTCTENGYTHIDCSLCGTVLSRTEHADTALGHDLVKTEAKAPTSTAEGNIAYYTCTECGKIYTDATAAKEITLEDTVIPKVDISTDGSPETGELIPVSLMVSVMLLSCAAFVLTLKKRAF